MENDKQLNTAGTVLFVAWLESLDEEYKKRITYSPAQFVAVFKLFQHLLMQDIQSEGIFERISRSLD